MRLCPAAFRQPAGWLSLATLLAGSVLPSAAQVQPNDVRYAAERVTTRQDAYKQGGGDMQPVTSLVGAGRDATGSDLVAAYRAYTHGMVIVYGGTWNPETELTTGVDFTIGAKVLGPGEFLQARATFLFDAPEAPNPPYRMEMAILKPDGTTEEAAVTPGITLGDVRGRRGGETIGLAFDVSKLAGPGLHTLRAILKNGQGTKLYEYWRTFILVPDLEKRAADLQKTLELAPDQKSVASTTARYVFETVSLARRTYLSGALSNMAGYLNTSFNIRGEVMDYDAELTFAAGLAQGLAAGRDPLAGAKGNLHLAYRSTFDGKLVPFRLFVPQSYGAAKPFPLLVMLHGSGGDENTFLAGGDRWQKPAEERGYILAAPNGRGPTSGYAKENGAQQDVLDVVALARKAYKIDPQRVFLTGHSMGGMGTWNIGMGNRDVFAALLPMAGARETPALLEAMTAPGRKIPVMLFCGGKDPLMTPANCRNMVAKAKSAGYAVDYIEYPDDDHWAVVSHAMPDLFDWLGKRNQ